jgi:hypothetical protein
LNIIIYKYILFTRVCGNDYQDPVGMYMIQIYWERVGVSVVVWGLEHRYN